MSTIEFESFAHRHPPVTHVFVYGTLRRGQVNDITRLHPAPVWVGESSVLGTLYDLGAYPGVVLGGTSSVRGEVYAIRAALEQRLDEIEGLYPKHTGEYRKRGLTLPVRLTGGSVRNIECLCYEINPAHLGAASVIASGDWLLRDVAI